MNSSQKHEMRMKRRAVRRSRRICRYHVKRRNQWGDEKVISSFQNKNYAVIFAIRGNERGRIPRWGYNSLYVLDSHTGERVPWNEYDKENKVDWLREGF